MFSSDEGLGEKTPSNSLPAPRKKRSRYKPVTLARAGGRPRTLSFGERMEAWHAHTMGASIPELALKFITSITKIQEAIEAAAQELGYPHNHIDPELERFKIVTAADQMKSAQVKLLQRSNETLKEIERQQQEIRQQRESIVFDTKPTEDELHLVESLMRQEAMLEARHQAEVKSAVSIMAEYRATNLVVADLTGIKRTKPVRKPKTVKTPEQLLEEADLSTEQLIELAEAS